MESKDTMLVTMTLGQLIQAITEDPAIKEMVLGMVKTVLTNNEVEHIKDAVMQDGRVILTEVAKAKRLYREWTEKNGTFAHLPKDE